VPESLNPRCARVDAQKPGAAKLHPIHMSQPDLFGEPAHFPAGFRYAERFITAREEQDLVREFEGLAFKEFEFHGFVGKRRVVSLAGTTTSITAGCTRPRICRTSLARFARVPRLSPACLWPGLNRCCSPSTGRARPSAGTKTGRSLARSWESRCSRHVPFVCGAGWASGGSACHSRCSHAPPTCCKARRAPTGSTAYRLSTGSDIP
jgi:hypothetical protein